MCLDRKHIAPIKEQLEYNRNMLLQSIQQGQIQLELLKTLIKNKKEK